MNENNRPAQSETAAAEIWRFEKLISSDPQEGVAVIRELLRHLQSGPWSEGEIFGIHLAMEEALANAIRHGNGHDPCKTVRINLEVTADTFYARISDEGCGFDPGLIPDPTADENLERPSGRGLMLMRCYLDKVVHCTSGNTVELFKNRCADRLSK